LGTRFIMSLRQALKRSLEAGEEGLELPPDVAPPAAKKRRVGGAGAAATARGATGHGAAVQMELEVS
jgi:hypothetical protein